jgi:hypothetical protein
MEDAVDSSVSSASAIVPGQPSVSPTLINNESPQPEAMITDVKILPKNYTDCEFSDLVDLIGSFLVSALTAVSN